MIYMASGDFKELARRATYVKVWRDKAFNIAKIPKYDGHQIGLAFMICKFFDKKYLGSGATKEIKQNLQLDEELHKPIIKKKIKKNSLFFI